MRSWRILPDHRAAGLNMSIFKYANGKDTQIIVFSEYIWYFQRRLLLSALLLVSLSNTLFAMYLNRPSMVHDVSLLLTVMNIAYRIPMCCHSYIPSLIFIYCPMGGFRQWRDLFCWGSWVVILSYNLHLVLSNKPTVVCYGIRVDALLMPLQWHHNGYNGVSNHQRIDCLLNRLFRHRSKKTPKLHVTGLCAGIHRWPVNAPYKGPVTRKMLPFDDVIMAHCKIRNIFDQSDLIISLISTQKYKEIAFVIFFITYQVLHVIWHDNRVRFNIMV